MCAVVFCSFCSGVCSHFFASALSSVLTVIVFFYVCARTGSQKTLDAIDMICDILEFQIIMRECTRNAFSSSDLLR